MTYIIGGSGQAKETAAYILDCKVDNDITFVDKEKNANYINIRDREYSVILENCFLEEIKNRSEKPNVVIAIGEPKLRAKVAEKYSSFCNFPNIIHPSVSLLAVKKTGMGNVIAPTVFISIDCEIGNFNLINYGATIGHDCQIGDFNSIYPQSIISGNVKIGNRNLLGAGCSIIENISIGNNNILGMGGVCIRSVGDDNKYVGVPVKKLESYKK